MTTGTKGEESQRPASEERQTHYYTDKHMLVGASVVVVDMSWGGEGRDGGEREGAGWGEGARCVTVSRAVPVAVFFLGPSVVV